MNMSFITVTETEGIATITLNRPDKRNAMHGAMVQELLEALHFLANSDHNRVLIMQGHGEHFCAGGDIAWMKAMAVSNPDQNQEDAQLLADMIYALYTYPKPSIALVHGATMGGGMGLVSACDIAIAADTACFALSEVKIGITPSCASLDERISAR